MKLTRSSLGERVARAIAAEEFWHQNEEQTAQSIRDMQDRALRWSMRNLRGEDETLGYIRVVYPFYFSGYAPHGWCPTHVSARPTRMCGGLRARRRAVMRRQQGRHAMK